VIADPSFEQAPRYERQSIVTALGIRFWDTARDRAVTDGLVVTARGQRGSAVAVAFSTAGGVYAFQGIPGLRAIEYPVADPEPGLSPPAAQRLLVEVRDQLRRFVPIAFLVDVPYRGIYPLVLPSSPLSNGPPGFYLFSAVTRQPSTDLAMVRAELVDHANQQPAAHALLVVVLPDGTQFYGVADSRGCVAVAFPYPRFISSGGSPYGRVIQAQQWPINLQVRYQPDALVTPTGASLPDLVSVFRQSAAQIWPIGSGAPVAQWSAALVFGQEFIVRSTGESVLQIGSLASP
jgi:hypothetical protein